jgi:hypothetical protein
MKKNILPELAQNGAYRDPTDTIEKERKTVVQLRIQEMVSLPQSFFTTHRRQLTHTVIGWFSLAGIFFVGLCLLIGAGVSWVIDIDWILISSFLLASGWISNRVLALHLENFLQTTDDVPSDLKRLKEPGSSVLLRQASSFWGVSISTGSMAIFFVISFLVFASYLPGVSVPVFILSFIVSAALFRLPEEGRSSVLLLMRWALVAWVIPAGVLGLIIAGFLMASNFIVAVGLGLILAKKVRQQVTCSPEYKLQVI